MDARKRGRLDDGFIADGGFKKAKPEMDSLSTGVGSKSKPCTKFFSTGGCPYGDSCHFLHYVPGGYNAVAQMMNLRPSISPQSVRNGAPITTKTRLCSKYSSAEGCKFGDKCRFAHGEWELGKPGAPSHDDPRAMGVPHRLPGRINQAPTGPPTGFGASSSTKISVDASLCGAIIGKGGMNSKQICRETGVKLSIRDHERDPNLKNIELEGTFDQIAEASAMVRELILRIGSAAANHGKPPGGGPERKWQPGSNFKTKLCGNFAKGICTFGEKCHFAHGPADLRKPGIM